MKEIYNFVKTFRLGIEEMEQASCLSFIGPALFCLEIFSLLSLPLLIVCEIKSEIIVGMSVICNFSIIFRACMMRWSRKWAK